MGRHIFNATVFLLVVISLPSTLVFTLVINSVAISNFINDLLHGVLFRKDNLIVFFVLGCWWGLCALVYGLITFNRLGVVPLPKWVKVGLFVGVASICALFGAIVVSEIGKGYQNLLRGDFQHKLEDFFGHLGAFVFFGGAQVMLALLLVLKIWLVKTGRMQVPLLDSSVTFVNKPDDLTSKK